MDDATKTELETTRKWHAGEYCKRARVLAEHLVRAAKEVESDPNKLSMSLGDVEWAEFKRRAAVVDMLNYTISGPRF